MARTYEVNDAFTNQKLGKKIRAVCIPDPRHHVHHHLLRPYDLSQQVGPNFADCMLSRYDVVGAAPSCAHAVTPAFPGDASGLLR